MKRSEIRGDTIRNSRPVPACASLHPGYARWSMVTVDPGTHRRFDEDGLPDHARQ
jgi:hypothetical protein